METAKFLIQLCQSKFIFQKVKANRNFREFTRFFQTCWSHKINSIEIQKQFSYLEF
jgi:hypothetical protein